MPAWEYRKIDLADPRHLTSDIELLNAAGEEGWEVVHQRQQRRVSEKDRRQGACRRPLASRQMTRPRTIDYAQQNLFLGCWLVPNGWQSAGQALEVRCPIVRHSCDEHGCGNDLDAHSRNAGVNHSELLRRRPRHVNDSSPYEGAAVVDTDYNLNAGIDSRHADHRAKRQRAVGGREPFGSVWHFGIEGGSADVPFGSRCGRARKRNCQGLNTKSIHDASILSDCNA